MVMGGVATATECHPPVIDPVGIGYMGGAPSYGGGPPYGYAVSDPTGLLPTKIAACESWWAVLYAAIYDPGHYWTWGIAAYQLPVNDDAWAACVFARIGSPRELLCGKQVSCTGSSVSPVTTFHVCPSDYTPRLENYNWKCDYKYPQPDCLKSYVIKIDPLGQPSASTTVLGNIEPGQPLDLIATVHDQTGQVVPNVPLKLTSTVIADSGGHVHTGGTRPPGTLSRAGVTPGVTLTGNTGANGLSFRFTAPALAGDHRIAASCTDGKVCAQNGPDQLWVGIKGLIDIPAGHYDLTDSTGKIVGWTAEHPDNHYLSGPALDRLWEFGYLYSVVRFPLERRLQLNDASLERGGVFDIKLNWKSPHREHCRGAVVDVRANGGDGTLNIRSDADPMKYKIQDLGRDARIEAYWDVPPDANGNPVWALRHFHLRLLGTEGRTCP